MKRKPFIEEQPVSHVPMNLRDTCQQRKTGSQHHCIGDLHCSTYLYSRRLLNFSVGIPTMDPNDTVYYRAYAPANSIFHYCYGATKSVLWESLLLYPGSKVILVLTRMRHPHVYNKAVIPMQFAKCIQSYIVIRERAAIMIAKMAVWQDVFISMESLLI